MTKEISQSLGDTPQKHHGNVDYLKYVELDTEEGYSFLDGVSNKEVVGGAKTKFLFNVTAIILLKELESENREQPLTNMKSFLSMWVLAVFHRFLMKTINSGQKNMHN